MNGVEVSVNGLKASATGSIVTGWPIRIFKQRWRRELVTIQITILSQCPIPIVPKLSTRGLSSLINVRGVTVSRSTKTAFFNSKTVFWALSSITVARAVELNLPSPRCPPHPSSAERSVAVAHSPQRASKHVSLAHHTHTLESDFCRILYFNSHLDFQGLATLCNLNDKMDPGPHDCFPRRVNSFPRSVSLPSYSKSSSRSRPGEVYSCSSSFSFSSSSS